MLVDKDGLWFSVLKARYGEDGGRLKEGGRFGSAWWKSLTGICDGIGMGVWRLFCNCLTTKDNLITRVMLHEESTTCVGGCGVQKITDHLFITCSHFCQLWKHIRSWLCLSLVDTYFAQDHFYQFGQLRGFPRQSYLFLKLICFITLG